MGIIEKTCQGVSWNQVYKQLQTLTIEELRAGLSEPIAFVETVLKGLLRTFGKQALIANLKPLLQETLHKNNLVWEDVQPILETIDIVGALEAAAADPAAFLSRLSDLGGPVAFRLRIAMLKKPMVPVLAERGLAWRDVLPVLQLVDSVDELKAAAADPAAFLSRLSDLGGPAAFLLKHLVISGSGPSRCISFNIPSHTFAQKTRPSRSLIKPLPSPVLYPNTPMGPGLIPPWDMPVVPPSSAVATPNGSVASPGDLSLSPPTQYET